MYSDTTLAVTKTSPDSKTIEVTVSFEGMAGEVTFALKADELGMKIVCQSGPMAVFLHSANAVVLAPAED